MLSLDQVGYSMTLPIVGYQVLPELRRPGTERANQPLNAFSSQKPQGLESLPVAQIPPKLGPTLYSSANSSDDKIWPVDNQPERNLEFVSGCRPIGLVKGVTATESYVHFLFIIETRLIMARLSKKEPNRKTGLKCTWPGCRSKAIFKRNYELQRHVKKHSRRETFSCSAVNCQFRGPKAFYRADKLKNHVSAAHDDETLFACPVSGCRSALTPLPRDLLGLHIRNYNNGHCKAYWSYFAALDFGRTARTCPMEKCTRKLDIDDI